MDNHPLSQLENLFKTVDFVPAVELQNLTVFRGQNEVLRDVDLCVEEGSFLGIIGPNGGGKTTLLNVVLGKIIPTEGMVEVFGCNPRSLNRRRQTIGYVPQYQPIPEYFPASVYDVVLMGAYGVGRRFLPVKNEYKAHARHLLAQVKLDHVMDCPIGKLSGGQQQRVFIARALVTRPRLLLLDEPLRGVDVAGQAKFFDLLMELKHQYELTVIMVSHDFQHLVRFTDRIACLNKVIHWHERPEQISHELLSQAFKCEWEALLTQSGMDWSEREHPSKPSNPSDDRLNKENRK